MGSLTYYMTNINGSTSSNTVMLLNLLYSYIKSTHKTEIMIQITVVAKLIVIQWSPSIKTTADVQ